MAGSAPVEIEIPIAAKKAEVVPLPTTSAHIDEKPVHAISGELNTAGHSQTPSQVSAGGEAREVLSRIEDGGIEAKVADTTHHLKRIGENIIGDINGSHHTYIAEEKPKGHFGVLGRALKMAKEKGRDIIVKNLLSTNKK